MRCRVLRRLVLLTAAVAWCGPAAGDDYQCDDPGGCDALSTGSGGPTVVSFREGDIVSTERGYVVAGDSGWTPVD